MLRVGTYPFKRLYHTLELVLGQRILTYEIVKLLCVYLIISDCRIFTGQRTDDKRKRVYLHRVVFT